MNAIKQNIQNVKERILSDAQNCGRSPKEIQLLAVSKTRSVKLITEAIQAGQYAFGENYVQEGIEKIHYFSKNRMGNIKPQWHFIGPLQSNKTRSVAEYFDWCHTVDRFKLAERLSAQRPSNLPDLNVLIQVNISQEKTKSGVMLSELFDLASLISPLPKLKLCGLMAIPALIKDYHQQLVVFEEMHSAFLELKKEYPEWDILSLGMTNDMTAAIHAGSTLVRIGEGIFSHFEGKMNETS
ncbi:MAG: YggS family pyridoxal phosphate-dependent enzyme [Candidatus Hamiltonella defensa (Ceratovacuna japonica)]